MVLIILRLTTIDKDHMDITLTTHNKATLKEIIEGDMDITHTLAKMNHPINFEILNSLIFKVSNFHINKV